MSLINKTLPVAMAAALLLSVGCEWTGTSSDEAWNDAYSWVNFSGSYRLYGAVSTSPIGGDDDNGDQIIEVPVEKEAQGSTLDNISDYSGVLRYKPVVAGSVTITIDGVAFVDNGSEVLVGGNGGTIKYSTGAWTARTTHGTNPGRPITATYAFASTSSAPPILPNDPNESTVNITRFTVNQKGNLLTFVDNNGVTYNGRVTGANVPEDNRSAGSVRLNFEVAADSGAKVIGTFSGDWSGGKQSDGGVLSNRSLMGTYHHKKEHIELQGASGSISITPLPITSN